VVLKDIEQAVGEAVEQTVKETVKKVSLDHINGLG
jgi:hypothetical protein